MHLGIVRDKTYIWAMKKKRPLFWIIVFLNTFFIVVAFANRNIAEITQADGSVRVISTFTLLVTRLIMMNIVLLPIYWFTGRKKGNNTGLQE
jgi:hypothetical protein